MKPVSKDTNDDTDNNENDNNDCKDNNSDGNIAQSGKNANAYNT